MFFLSQPLVRAAAEPGAALPIEFMLFAKGVNESCNGSVLFDERSVEQVLSQAQRHGVDFIVDLEHYSIFGGSDTSRDARGWFQLEVRSGALWAVNVTWTDDGAERLRGRRQRYTSPAFYCDEWDDEAQLPRVTSLINCAICSMPATYGNVPLVASALNAARPLDGVRPSGYAPVRMSANAAAPAPVPAEVLPAATPADPVPGAAAPAAVEPAPDALAADVAAAEAEASAEVEQSAPAEPAAPAEPVAAEPSLEEQVRAISGAADVVSALIMFRALVADRDSRATVERRTLVNDLVALGAEIPATAWTNNAPAPRLAAEPLAELRARVAALRAARPEAAGHAAPPAGDALGDLSDADRANAEKIKDPTLRARFIETRRARHTSR
jgi:hypothetical protein